MNSGELDLKMRRKVSVAPPDAAADRVAAWAGGAAKPHAATTPAEAPASETIQVSRIERAREVLISSIRCAMLASGLRPARGLLPAAKREALPMTSRQEDHNAAAPARPANGRAPRPARRPHRRPPGAPPLPPAHRPRTAPAACRRYANP